MLIGDGGVGKTTFVKRHITGEFEKKYIATQGVEVSSITFYPNHGPIKLALWDTAGQDKYKTITKNYYRNSQGVIIVFGLDSRDSFYSVSTLPSIKGTGSRTFPTPWATPPRS